MSTAPPATRPLHRDLPASYPSLLEDLKKRIHAARMRAALAVTRELVTLYWEIGQSVVSRQEQEGWGRSVIERLSADLRAAFPDVRGFSPRNLWRMRAFYLAWSAEYEVLPQAVAELPWGHNAILLEKLDQPATRLWYAEQVAVHGWSRDVLALRIQSALHLRQGQAQTNFERTLPSVQSDLAQQVLKDPYTFGFLDLEDDALEREVDGPSSPTCARSCWSWAWALPSSATRSAWRSVETSSSSTCSSTTCTFAALSSSS